MAPETSFQVLGPHTLQIPPLGFGGAPLGNLYVPVEDERSDALLKALIESDIRYFDTAPFYGFGLSERRLGDALRQLPRDCYVLSTKVGRLLKPVPGHVGCEVRHGYASPMPFEPVYDYSYDAVMRSHEDSLQRLGLDRIDVLYVHDIGELTHGDENERHFRDLSTGGYRALDELRRSGDIKAIGLGVNEYQVCEAAMEIGQFDCFMLAGRYSLIEQEPLNGFFEKCEKHGAKIVAAGVYNSGILATGVSGDGPHYYNYEPAPDQIVDKVRKLEAVAAKYDVPLPAMALQFVTAHSIVASTCVGFGNPQRVKQTEDLLNTKIPNELWSDLADQGLIDPTAPVPDAR